MSKQSPLSALARISLQFLISVVVCGVLLELLSACLVSFLEERVPPAIRNFTDDEIRGLYNTDDVGTYREALLGTWRNFRVNYAPFIETANGPVTSKWLNVTPAGFRKNNESDQNTFSPEESLLFLFGGSTTFGVGVRDSETIAAFLEKELNAKGHKGIRVVNWGSPGHFSTQEVILFQQLLSREQKPVGAVFIDGLNDFFQCRVPDESQMTPMLRRAATLVRAQPILSVLVSSLSTTRLIGLLRGTVAIEHLGESTYCSSRDELMKVVKRLETNREIVRGIGREFKISTLFVQQPVPTFAFDNARRAVQFPEERLTYHRNSGAGYELIDDLKKKGEISTENLLSLERLSIKENQYIDVVHYSPRFNAKIASEIAGPVEAWFGGTSFTGE